MKTLKNTILVSLLAGSLTFIQAATWTGAGADKLWSTDQNWGSNLPPSNDGTEAVTLSGGAGGESNVDSPWAVKSITFSGAAGAFTLLGSEISLYGSGAGADSNYLIANSSYSVPTQTVQNNLKMMAAGAFRANTRDLILSGDIDFNDVSNVRFLAEPTRTLVLDGVLKGSTGGTVAFSGSGIIEVNGDNTYKGTTKIWGSTTVKVGSNAAFGTSTSTIMLGSESPTGGGTPTLLTNGAVTVSRTLRIYTSSSAERVVTIGGASADVSEFTGSIYTKTYDVSALDAMPLTMTAAAGGRVNMRGNITRESNSTGSRDNFKKTGTGIVALYGTNTYSGTTTVEEGTLLVNGEISNANFVGNGGSVIVKSGASLGGNEGIINRDVSIESGATFAPGDVDADGLTSLAGSLTINGNLSFEAGSLLQFDFGDTVTVDGDLSLAGSFSFLDPELWSAGTHTLFSYTGSLVDLGVSLDPSLEGTFSLDTATTGLVQLHVIPEPAAFSSFLGFLLLLSITLKRKI